MNLILVKSFLFNFADLERLPILTFYIMEMSSLIDLGMVHKSK